MSNGLTLPFAGTLDSDKQVFAITQPARGGVAIWAFSSGVKADGSPGVGVSGTSYPGGTGVSGVSDSGPGLHGHSDHGEGVRGESQSNQHGGVSGINTSGGPGVYGSASASDGVYGQSQSNQHAGVSGINGSGGPGVYGSANAWDAIVGETQSDAHAGVTGRNLTGGANGGVGIYGVGGKYAGKFDGNHQINGNSEVWGSSECHGNSEVIGDHHVSGTVRVDVDVMLKGGDCAEQFTVVSLAKSEPGTVMVINEGGELEPSRVPYDKKVAGVVSGAGGLRPGIILDKQGPGENRVSVALLGKVYCKVDAQCAPVEVGDLLTTSPNPGHAMKADDPAKAFGAVIGKALGSLRSGQGLIPILIALQ